MSTVLTELLIRSGYSIETEIVAKKSQLEQEETLAELSQGIGAGYLVKLGLEEKQQQAYNDPTLLAQTLLAILGGIYFDGGFSAARETIRRLFQELLRVH